MDAHDALEATQAEDRPRDDEIDGFGMTHPGRVRPQNEDHFLLCALYKTLKVHATSLPAEHSLPTRRERLGFLAAVADGLGGLARGEAASRLTMENIASYATHCMDCFFDGDPWKEELFLEHLQQAVLRCHEALREQSERELDGSKMATTLTLLLTVWPRAYLVHVGDSRCYLLHEGELSRLTRDQTLAEYLVESGAMPREQAEAGPFSHVLSSAIGGSEALPVASVTSIYRGDRLLLCTDGLTRHVRDEEIREHLLSSKPAKEICQELVDLALERGGTDNVTVVLGGSSPPPSEG